ncbi:MAG: DnaD domain protein [Selenomonas sp.]|uniref:DnaD domain protein n=1 Tax=Selenomonas sp. TaxID=2053611 RepID=UPI0025FF8442|nr:DnaD domain protein [Selenomonas sp.]MCR5440290.1 DnaD domain protein [Selenomonas sp.]
MAERRMFAKTIIDSDNFLDMSLSTQALYFHLAMRADDDGFINNPKRIQRMIGASDDELKMLIAKQYIIPFDSGVVVIKHWRIHNYIRKDRKQPSTCEEVNQLQVDSQGMYELLPPCQPSDNQATTARRTPCQPSDNQATAKRSTQVSIGKDSIELGKSKDRDRDSIAAAAIARNTSFSGKCQDDNQDFYDDDRGEVVKAFCDNLQPFAGNLVLEQLNDAYDRYGKQWCLEAIKETAVNGGRSIQYVIKVLERWERDGFKSARKQKSVKESANGWQDMAADLLEDLEGDGREH